MRYKRIFKTEHFVYICLAAFVCDWIIFPILFQRFVHSRYFKLKTDEEFEDLITQQFKSREFNSILYFGKMSKLQESRVLDERTKLKLLVMVITVHRKQKGYLTQTMAELDSQMKEILKAGVSNVDLFVCNSDLQPSDHDEANHLKKFVQVVDVEMKERTHTCCSADDCPLSGKSKQKSDYFECVSKARNLFSFENILILEDDSYPKQTALSDVLQVLDHKLDHRPNWFQAKLFYSLEYQGFQVDIISIVELVSMSLITAQVLIEAHFKFFGWKSILVPEKWSFLPWLILVIMFYLALGRQHTLLALRSFLTPFRIENAHADANLAILYPENKIDLLMDVLQHHLTCDGPEIDLEVFKVLQDMGENQIWIQGQFFEHIGFYTSLSFKNGKKNLKSFASQYLYLP